MSLSKISAEKFDINSLPNELLYLILKNLSIQQKILAERVCRKWQQLIQSLYLTHTSLRINNGWSLGHYVSCSDSHHNQTNGDINFIEKTSNFWSFRNELNKSRLTPILKRCPNFKSIHLENCRIDSEAFLYLIEKSPKLECLALIEINGFCVNEWQQVVNKLGKKLIHFSISDCQTIYSESLMPIIPQLQELFIHYQQTPLNETLSHLGPNIRKLALKCCEDSNVNTIETLASGYGQNITHLTIDDPWIDDEIKTLQLVCRHLKNLEYLSIGFGALSPAIRPIIELKRLRHLELNANLDRWSGIKSLPLNSMNGIESLLLNAYFAPKYLNGIENIFPNVKRLRLFYYCDCTETIRMCYYYCESCHKICFVFINKMKFLRLIQLNGQKLVKRFKN
jgi:hypothetical protein